MRASNVTTPTAGRARRGIRWTAALVGAAWMVVAGVAGAQDDYDPRYEFSIGFGGASASEESIFNLAIDSPSEPELLMDFRFRQRLTPRLAIGLHGYATGETTPEYIVTDGLGNIVSQTAYDMAIVHLGVHARYLLMDPPFQPYFEAGVSYVSGSASEDRAGDLALNGYSFGGGPGVMYLIGSRWGLGAQGLFAVGTARWEKHPFANSSSRRYDPGFVGGEGFFFVRWGR